MDNVLIVATLIALALVAIIAAWDARIAAEEKRHNRHNRQIVTSRSFRRGGAK